MDPDIPTRSPCKANDRGLAAVPLEIILGILSHFACVPVPYDLTDGLIVPLSPSSLGPLQGAGYEEKSSALRALSQTCSRLRHITLPILFEKIEVITRVLPRWDYAKYRRNLVRLFERTLKTLSQQPSLAEHTRQITIAFDGITFRSIALSGFVGLMRTMQNLTVVQLLSVNWMTTNVFDNTSFPNVKILSVTGGTRSMMEQFPNVEEFYTFSDNVMDTYNAGQTIEAMVRSWPKLRIFRGVVVQTPVQMQTLSTLRNLEEITFPSPKYMTSVAILQSSVHFFEDMTALKRIRLFCHTDEDCEMDVLETFARELLQQWKAAVESDARKPRRQDISLERSVHIVVRRTRDDTGNLLLRPYLKVLI